MTLEPGPLITLGLAGVAVIVWLVRLEGRVNGTATTNQLATLTTTYSVAPTMLFFGLN